MSTIRHEQTIAVTPAAIWRTLARFDALVEWADSIDHSSLLGAQEEGIGTSRRVQTGAVVLVEVVTVWRPESVLAYELQGLPPFVSKAVNEWTIEGAGEQTRVALTAHLISGPRPPMRLATRVLGRRVGAANAGLLADLARTIAPRSNEGS